MAALIHAAIAKYITSGKVKDVSEAVDLLFTHDVQLPEAMIDPNDFRRQHCCTHRRACVVVCVRVCVRVSTASACTVPSLRLMTRARFRHCDS
jgi:hypothetical protein